MKYLNRTFRNTEDLYLKFQTMFPNIPVLHWREYKDKKVSDKCWKIPNILDLHYSNKYWQVKETNDGTFFLYAAYYDVREGHRIIISCWRLYLSLNLSKTKFNCLKPKLRSGVPEPTVRILGMIDKFQSKVISLIINHMGRFKMKILGQNFL